MRTQVFTVKSLIFGLIGLLVVSCFPALAATSLSMGDSIKGYLPILPVFLIILLSFGWNALAGRFCKRLVLGSGELAVVFCLMLMMAWIPSMQQALVRTLVLPRYEEFSTNASWQEAGVTARLPERIFPRGADGETIGERTHFGMIQGRMPFSAIPYDAWIGPLLHLLPLVLVLSIGLLALTFMVHRQWSVHEQLRYPVASVVDALIEQDSRGAAGAIFRNRLFWVGFAFVFGLHLLRYLHTWFPANMPMPRVEYGLKWSTLFPRMMPSNAGMFLLEWMPISFALLGIAYFVPADVSLSVGLTAPLGTLLGIQYYLISGNPVSSGDLDVFRAGGFIAFGIILTYTGRTYYFPILRKAIWPGRSGQNVDPGGVWAARVFLSAFLALVLIVTGMGVGLLMAWLIVTFVLLIFLVVTRLVCETGIPLITPGWSLQGVLGGLFGTAALGATPLMFITFLSSTLVSSSSSQLAMPYMATSLKILDDNKVKLGRFVLVAKLGMLVALVAGAAAVITILYTKGAGNLNGNERSLWEQSARSVLTMMDFGQYEASQAAHGVAKLGLISPDGHTVRLVLIGLVVVMGCYLLRFRFAKWPLHPLFFVVLGTGFANTSWTCFLLGWVIKSLVVKVGGGRTYRSAKPLFVGFIAAELMAIGMMLVVGLIYHAITGKAPVTPWML